jgi:hypothetical protein
MHWWCCQWLLTAHPLIFFSTMSTMAFSYSHFIVFWSADQTKKERDQEKVSAHLSSQ